MTEEKIRNAAAALGVLAATLGPDQLGLVQCVRAELVDAADQVNIYESCLSAELIAGVADMAEFPRITV